MIATKNVAVAKTAAEKADAKAPIVLTLNKNDATVPAKTLQTLSSSSASGLHLLTGNGTAVTISNGKSLKNQGAINLTNKVTTTKNSKIIAFTSNTKLNTLCAVHTTVPAGTKAVKLYATINGTRVSLMTLKPTAAGQVYFPITQLGIFELVY